MFLFKHIYYNILIIYMIHVEGSEYVERNGVIEKNNSYNITSNKNNAFDVSLKSKDKYIEYDNITSDQLLNIMSKPKYINSNDIDFQHLEFLLPKKKKSLKRKPRYKKKKSLKKGKKI